MLQHLLAEVILMELQKRNTNITLCRGQAYDGTSVKSENKNGLKTQINTLLPNGINVHCCVYALIW